jgi:hypothetical protein
VSGIDDCLAQAMAIHGAIGASIIDHTTGFAVGAVGTSPTDDPDATWAGAAEIVNVEMLNLKESIEDILITLDTQYHMIRPLTGRAGKGLFLYVALMKNRANLAMARHHLRHIESNMDV